MEIDQTAEVSDDAMKKITFGEERFDDPRGYKASFAGDTDPDLLRIL